ncbi:MAG: DNA-binding response regulator [Rubritepida sp.]|nr:DNA-binding response regulator [Rubritepida sp.]
MPELNGLEAARKIRATCPATEVLVFTMYETEDLVADVFAAGARGYVMKSDPPHHIIAAIETVASHEPFFSTRVSAQLLETFLRDRAEYAGEDPTGATLSTREREVVQLLAEGRRNKEIALRLSLGVKTVETHRAAIMRKIGAASIAEVVRYAVRSRIASA